MIMNRVTTALALLPVLEQVLALERRRATLAVRGGCLCWPVERRFGFASPVADCQIGADEWALSVIANRFHPIRFVVTTKSK